jgi:hypothetical protein
MWILRSRAVLALGAAAALAGAMASSSVACSSSSSGGNTGSSSGSSSSGGEGGGGEPTLSITMPTSGATVTPTGAMSTVDVAFTVTNFSFFAPGAAGCDAKSDNCGHIHVLVDGSACTPSGSPYDNADQTGSPAQAILSTCPKVSGAHTISLELHHTDHSPIQVNGMTVSASVMVTAGSGGGGAGSD